MSQVLNGPELTEVFTTSIGFKSIAGEVKVQLPIQWPQDAQPPTTSSLLSIASSKGLLAAAGADSLVVVSTDRLRGAYKDAKTKDEIVKLDPELIIPTPRLSHVTFTSDSSCLIVAAENGGGLAAHATEALKANHKEPNFELSTEGVAVRALAPNPSPELAHFVAVLLANGHLMLANFQERSFVRGANGFSIRDNVTSVAWSVRGKQLVAGLSDGTAVQLDAQGATKAVIPRPPGLEGNLCLSTIVWLANDEFLVIHSRQSAPSDAPPDAVFHWVRTDKDRTKFEFRKAANEPCFPVQNRAPASYFASRLRKWSALEDVVILSSSASSDVGLLTNSKVSLSASGDTAGTTDVYAVTILDNDTRKAALPMSAADSMNDTYPIGQAIDLSSKDNVWQPIPGDDSVADQTPHPLPALVLLNNEGILLYWWFINDEALRKPASQEVPYPGLVSLVASSNTSQMDTAAALVDSAAKAQSAFASGFGAPSMAAATPAQPKLEQTTFGTPALGAPSQTGFGKSAFGQSSFGRPAFGSASAFGSSSPWSVSSSINNAPNAATGPAFGKPSFGSSAGPAPGFGQTATLGQASPWGTPSNAGSTTAPKAPFGSSTASASGFAKFSAPTSAFGSLGNTKPDSASPFASAIGNKSTPFGNFKNESSFNQTPQQSFGSTVTIGSTTGGSTVGNQSLFGSTAFGAPAKPNSFFGQAAANKTEETSLRKDENMSEDPAPENKPEAPSQQPAPAGFLGSKIPFSITSSFQPAQSAKERDEESGVPKSSTSGFGLGSLGNGLTTSTPEVKPDPSLPSKSLFDIPLKTENEPPSKPADAEVQPAPPEVVSKPAPSSSSGTFSGDSSTIIKSTEEIDGFARSPAESDDEGIEAGEDLSSEENDIEGPDPSDVNSANHNEDLGTQARAEPAAPTPSSHDSSFTDREHSITPPGKDPSIPNPALKLEGHPFGRSPLNDSTGIPPPVPTPPVSGPSRLFPSLASSTTPTGLPAAPIFPPPKPQESPRSPSPIRRPISQNTQPVRTIVASQPITDPGARHSTTSPAQLDGVRGHVLSDLQDDRDEAIRIDLTKPLAPTTELPAFVAHTDYAGRLDLEEVAGNVERVFRDINSMIDTLGQNARALAAFVAGHQEESEADAEGTDINDASDIWTFDDIDRLRSLEHNLERSLISNSIQNTNDLRTEITEVKRGLRPAKEDQKKIKAFLQAYKDPTAQNRRRHAPLDPDAASRQRDVLMQLAAFKKILAETEDKATMVKAKLTSRGAAKHVPTVEAVEKTIRKMTAMVQRRSMEVDYLESQMRKLGLSGSAAISNKAGSVRNSPAKGRSFGLVDNEDEEGDYEQEADTEWRVQRTVAIRAKRRVILAKIKEELDKKGSTGLSQSATIH